MLIVTENQDHSICFVLNANLDKADFYYKNDLEFIPYSGNDLNRVCTFRTNDDVIIPEILNAGERKSYLSKLKYTKNNYTPVIIPTLYNYWERDELVFGYYIDEKDIVIISDVMFTLGRSIGEINFKPIIDNLNKFKNINFLYRYLYLLCKEISGNKVSLMDRINLFGKNIPEEFIDYVRKIEYLE